MSALTTHVLDTALGRPAAGVAVRLERLRDGEPVELGNGITDVDGRIEHLGPDHLEITTHRLVFDVASYARSTGQTYFLAAVDITFTPTGDGRLHVPLLLSPFACSAYRGS
ncbi:hydroxyisourate hydrolase [Nocardia inohanensis]|uniref:hydroxyisourate hydrolase n=1 Tax=Nocardia inohanensis TaxID=209246 RepID=UPI00082E66FE|nr:hydroxyisourate hydrolase [Nocardia inohanensis]